jgi:EAL domain-containing protein (putative c-di-GMP-specific phosphodiesterase class I)
MANDAALALVRRQQSKVEEIRRLLDPGTIAAVFQPVLRVADGEVAAYEGYSRFPRLTLHGELSPDAVLALAGEVGLRDDLEVACWEAIAAAGTPPAGRQLILNISPASLAHGGLLALASRLPDKLVLELAEPPALLRPHVLREHVRPWRERGARIAVDEGGAGHAALEQLVELRPDYLKLSRALVSSLESDANARARLRSLVSFARHVGAELIAAGVETEAQLAVLREAGVDMAMGWLFGRPEAPWPEPARPLAPVVQAPAPAPTAPPMTPPPATASLIASGQALVDAALDDLASRGLTVSVYVERGGVLRCRAVRGAWQVPDGLAPSEGVVGEAFRTGSPASGSPEELCVPCFEGTAVVGVLRVAAGAPLVPAQRESAELCARVVGPRLLATDPPTLTQRLARRARRLAALLDHADIAGEALSATRELSGMATAAIVLREEDGALRLTAADGPLAAPMTQLRPEDWAAAGSWVEGAASCLTTGIPEGAALPGGDRLRRLGTGSLLVVPLPSAGPSHGLLVAAGSEPNPVEPESVEMLEMLGGLIASALESAATVERLRQQVATDPVTGLSRADGLGDAIARLRGTASTVSVVTVAIPAGAAEDLVRGAVEVVRRSAPEGSSLLRTDGGLLLVFGAEGAAHSQAIAALVEARGADVVAGGFKTAVVLAEADETDAVLRARCDVALAAGAV